MLSTCIEYHSTNPYDTYTMYNPADVHWDVLNDIMSSYYLHNHWIFGLNGLDVAIPCQLLHVREVDIHTSASFENLANSWPPSANTHIHAQESKVWQFIISGNRGWHNNSHMTTQVAQSPQVYICSSITPQKGLVTILNRGLSLAQWFTYDHSSSTRHLCLYTLVNHTMERVGNPFEQRRLWRWQAGYIVTVTATGAV
jgi:hypothetical protein